MQFFCRIFSQGQYTLYSTVFVVALMLLQMPHLLHLFVLWGYQYSRATQKRFPDSQADCVVVGYIQPPSSDITHATESHYPFRRTCDDQYV